MEVYRPPIPTNLYYNKLVSLLFELLNKKFQKERLTNNQTFLKKVKVEEVFLRVTIYKCTTHILVMNLDIKNHQERINQTQ